MSEVVIVESVHALAKAVRDMSKAGEAVSRSVLPVGARTKPGLTSCPNGTVQLDMRNLAGIISYEPSEYLISALAGTPVANLQSALKERGQYLPFDPLFVEQGSTIGGCLASGISGLNRLLYGSIRDFVMEVEFVDGLGQLVRGGGKVVKNAAGFDLPKLLVGSYGRLGIVTETTLKVFPEPAASATLSAKFSNLSPAISAVQSVMSLPLPIAAIEIEPSLNSDSANLWIRFAGSPESLHGVVARGQRAISGLSEAVDDPQAELHLWQSLRSFANASDDSTNASPSLLRAATTLEASPSLQQLCKDCRVTALRFSCAGSVAWIACNDDTDVGELDRGLAERRVPAVEVLKQTDLLTLIGDRAWMEPTRRIQNAIDPLRLFAEF